MASVGMDLISGIELLTIYDAIVTIREGIVKFDGKQYDLKK